MLDNAFVFTGVTLVVAGGVYWFLALLSTETTGEYRGIARPYFAVIAAGVAIFLIPKFIHDISLLYISLLR